MSQANSAAVMPSTEGNPPERAPVTDHLSVRPANAGPREVHFQFEQQQQRMGGALGVSVLSHAAFIVAIFLFIRFVPEPVRTAILPDRLNDDIVWLTQPGPGGGGGGGNKSPDPPKKAELTGKEKITVPAIKAPDPTPTKPEEPPVEQLDIPARTMAADTAVAAPGVLDSTRTDTSSTGSGTGTGAGSGQGSGLGEGSGGGTGGGVFQVGNGVESPRPIRQPKPSYTSEAMRAKVQGVTLLECIVEKDGSIDDCKVRRSLDQAFGLDQEAIKAARQWRFQPGTRQGEPVRVAVIIEMGFTLR